MGRSPIETLGACCPACCSLRQGQGPLRGFRVPGVEIP